MKYTITQFNKEFPTDEACLDHIFNKKFDSKGYYKVTGRKCYANTKGEQIHPLKGTIFEKSSTPLTLWFYAIFLFSQSKNGVSAKELQRQLGVTYKCAWRIANSIRSLMKQGGDMLGGIVEVDETFYGGRTVGHKNKFKKKTAVMGMVERKGNIKTSTIPNRETHIVLNQIKNNVSGGTHIMSDEYSAYKKLPKLGFGSQRVKHGKGNYVLGNVHTNTIEGFWGNWKSSIKGTYRAISPKHLQSYLDEFAFQYNLRLSSVSVFEVLIGKV